MIALFAIKIEAVFEVKIQRNLNLIKLQENLISNHVEKRILPSVTDGRFFYKDTEHSPGVLIIC